MRIQAHDRVGVVGKTGCGKGNRVKALIADELAHGSRVVVFDPHDEYSRHGRKTEQVRLGPLRDRLGAHDLMRDPKVLDRDDLSLSVVPDWSSRKSVADDFKEVVGVVSSTGNMILVIEEIGVFGALAEDELEDAACQLRHESVGVVLVAQRAMQIPKTARTQLSQLYSGIQNDPDDLNVLRKIAGAKFAERVPCLPPGELLHWHDQTHRTEKNR